MEPQYACQRAACNHAPAITSREPLPAGAAIHRCLD
jgi:hypothetical protein